jgi:hypothetical protein
MEQMQAKYCIAITALRSNNAGIKKASSGHFTSSLTAASSGWCIQRSTHDAIWKPCVPYCLVVSLCKFSSGTHMCAAAILAAKNEYNSMCYAENWVEACLDALSSVYAYSSMLRCYALVPMMQLSHCVF